MTPLTPVLILLIVATIYFGLKFNMWYFKRVMRQIREAQEKYS